MNEKISVIIPVYNTEAYLSRCLDSVLNNTYRNLEVICINDGSKDNSLAILREYERRDDRVVVIDQKNGGVSKARNAGLDIATGEFIAFVDSDDWVHSQYFELLLIVALQTGADITVCGEIQTEKECLEESTLEVPRTVCVVNREIAAAEYRVKDHIWGRIYKRAIATCGFDEDVQLAEDRVWNMRVLCEAEKIAVFDAEMYFYYQRADSAVHTLYHKEISAAGIALLRHVEKTPNPILLKEAYKSFLASRYLSMFDLSRDDKKMFSESFKKCRKKDYLLSAKERILYGLFSRIPLLYRLYRIYGDRTMLAWEKTQRKARKERKL